MNPGTVVDGKYRVERRLGEGGMAVVYEATRVHLDERVALKVLQGNLASDPVVVERFMREARAAARLKSERVPLILDVGTLPTQQPYIAMEFLDGVDLEQALRDRGKLSLTEAVDYVLQICEPLAEAHAAGIVHRDIKPANCIVVQRRGAALVKVLDFGIAKLMLGDGGPKLTGTQATMGTPAFMSPEQIRGAKDVDHRADIWSLGITLFQLVTGNLPFGGNTYAKLVMSVSREPTPQIPTNPALDAVLQRSLAKDRNERYSTIGELARALEPFAGDRPLAASIVQRCVALGAELNKRLGLPPPAAAPAQGLQRTSTLPMGQTPTLPTASTTTPAHGARPMSTATPSHGSMPITATPAHGSLPMTATPGHGSMPMTSTPAHGAPPMSTSTPPHGANPMTTTPPRGAMPMTSTPGHGSLPMTATPAHGSLPMTATPAHGSVPMTTQGASPMSNPAAPRKGSSVVVIALVALAVIAVAAVVFALTR